MQLSSIVGSLAGAYIIWNVARFLQSYRAARKIGVPICLVPVDFYSFFWIFFAVPLRPIFQRYLPEELAFRLEIATFGSEFNVRDKILKRHGGVFVLCGIGSLQFWCADAQLATVLLQKPREFPPAKIIQDVLAMCGPNILSTTGEQWQRQRKVISPMINERISAATWDATASQAKSMLDFYTAIGGKGTTSSMEGLKQLAFNVLGVVAYGKDKPWQDPHREISPSDTDSAFINILLRIANNLVVAALLPKQLLLSPVMPNFLRSVGQALVDFPKAADGMIAEERKKGMASNTLLSTIVKMADDETNQSKLYLTPDEITGNLFSFTLAGYDTTANTMAYALTNLAIYPEWQEWIMEEIDQVSRQGGGYTESFPQLKRILALMLETLRLYSPLVHVLRRCLVPAMVTTDNGTQLVIPTGTEIQISFALIHANPKYWGDDGVNFRPSRWIKEDGSMLDPAKGSFTPWSSGPRSCPGIKMAQVEFVSAFYTIFKHSRIEPILRGNEDLEAARKRLLAVMMDSQPIITLQMNKPKEVELRWLVR